MSVELIQKLVDVTEMTHKETSQIVKERDMIVPDGKPDMQRVLLLDGKIRMDQIDIQTNRIVYKGQVDVTILYVPEDAAAGVVKMTGTIPLEDFMIVEGLEADNRVDFKYEIEHMHWNVLNERKINVKAIIELSVESTRSKEISMVEDISTTDPIQKKMERIDIVNMMPFKEEKVIIKDELTIPQGKAPIQEILKLITRIQEEHVKRTADELIFSGMIEVATLYQAIESESGSGLEVVSHKIPFSGAVDLPQEDEEVYWDCELEVSPTYVQVNPDYDGEDRIIEIENIVIAKYTIFNNDTSEIVDDIYCPGKKVQGKGNSEFYMNLAHKENISAPKKELLNVEGIGPDAQTLYDVELKAKVDDKILEGDNLTIEGTIEARILYVDEAGPNKINSHTEYIPFEMEVQVPSGGTKYSVNVQVKPKDVQVTNFNKESIGLDYILEYLVNIYEQKEIHVLEDITFEDMSKDELATYPSITVYTVKAGENLWDLAKRFNTTVKDIVEVNEVDPSYQPRQGEKVIIVKKNKF